MHHITTRTPYELGGPVGVLHKRIAEALHAASAEQHAIREAERKQRQAALAAQKRPGMPSVEHPRFRKVTAKAAVAKAGA